VQFDEFMISEAEKRGVEFLFETHVHSFKRAYDKWRIEGKTSEKKVEVQCNFVADATGRKAVFASNQGSKKQVLDKLVGIYQYYKIHSEEKQITQGTFIESDANGWWYSATLPNDYLVVAYMTDSDLATQNSWKSDGCFQELLKQTKHTQKRLFHAEELGAPQLAAAHSQILDEIVGDHWLTLGDATMSFDPLSSLGIYKALSGSIYGAYAALDCLKGEPRGLQKYDQIMRVQYQNYLKKRDDHYSEEKRFEEFPFWNRRIKQLHKTNMNQITNTTNYETIDVL
jgi:flavin-dependent dehydrogenase